LLCAAIAQISQARTSPIEARLVVPYTRLLPGVPFEMWVDLYNASENTVHVALDGPLRITVVGGIDFECRGGCQKWLNNQNRSEGWARSVGAVLAPGERRTIALPIRRELSGAPIVDSVVLSKAVGRTCAIWVELHVVDADPRAPSTKLPPKIDEPLITNEVQIEIMAPSGDDAKVWDRMLASSDGGWTPVNAGDVDSRTLWSEVLSEYPSSNYVPYAVLATSTAPSDEALDHLLAAIAQFPDSPVVEVLHVRAWRLARILGRTWVADAEGAIVARSARPTTRSVICPIEDRCADDSR
jgi:hypothetical protein